MLGYNTFFHLYKLISRLKFPLKISGRWVYGAIFLMEIRECSLCCRNGEMLVMTEHIVPSWDGQVARLELRGLREEDAGRAINRIYTITEQVTFRANEMTQ